MDGSPEEQPTITLSCPASREMEALLLTGEDGRLGRRAARCLELVLGAKKLMAIDPTPVINQNTSLRKVFPFRETAM